MMSPFVVTPVMQQGPGQVTVTEQTLLGKLTKLRSAVEGMQTNLLLFYEDTLLGLT